MACATMPQRITIEHAPAEHARGGDGPPFAREDVPPSIRIVFPARPGQACAPPISTTQETAALSDVSDGEEAATAGRLQGNSLSKKRLRKWLKSLARVFDYRPETIARLEAERLRWPVVGMPPVQIVSARVPAHHHQQHMGPNGQPLPRQRRLRRQRDLIQRSDSGVSVKTLPKYNALLDDTEVMLFKTESDDADESLARAAQRRNLASEEGGVDARVQQPSIAAGSSDHITRTSLDEEWQAGHVEHEAQRPDRLRTLGPTPAYTAAEQIECEPTVHPNFSMQAPEPIPELPRYSPDASAPDDDRSSLPEEQQDMMPRLRRFTTAMASRPLNRHGQRILTMSRRESLERLTSPQPQFGGGRRSGFYAGSSSANSIHGIFATSAPVTRNASLVSLLPLTLQNALGGEDGIAGNGARRSSDCLTQTSAPASRRQSMSTSSAPTTSKRNVAALAAALAARDLPFAPPASGFSEQQLAFLASVESFDWNGTPSYENAVEQGEQTPAVQVPAASPWYRAVSQSIP